MEYVVFALVMIFFIVLMMIKGYYDDNKRKAKFARWLKENYGTLPERMEYKEADFIRVSKYYENHKKVGFHIDDITWNDLNMNRVFSSMNYTYSSAGEEYLYYMLRTPVQEKNSQEELEKYIQFFMTHEKERVFFQTNFAELGNTGKYSIYDYLNYLDGMEERSSLKDHLGNLCIFLSIGVMFVSLQVGLFLFFIAIANNIMRYFRVKKEIDPYITSFAYIFRLMLCAKTLEKLPEDVFKDSLEQLRKNRKEMGKFKAGSHILMSKARGNAGSDLIEIFLEYVRMTFHLDLIKFNQMLREVKCNRKAIGKMIRLSGYLEATIAIGAYRTAKQIWCIPTFVDQLGIASKNMYHPLVEDPVKNSIHTKRGVLLTGSNASGKSTFLKTVAINAIVSQCINTCFAESYCGTQFRILSSMSLRDDLVGGDSYYMVEIKALKRILDISKQEGKPVLCFVDEVLRGTNTVERIAASTQILKSLNKHNILCFAATHDIELTHLLQEKYANYHFEEEIVSEDVHFNYRLLEGRAVTRNAIKLLSVMGYDKQLILDAEEMAEGFLEKGKWMTKV